MLWTFSDGVFALDSGYGRPQFDAIHLVVDRGEVAVVDTANNASVPRVLDALAVLGLPLDAVRYVLLTHIHLDHAGGAGALMQRLPAASLVVHPRGARHLVEPSKLWAGTVAVYGETQACALYGELVPVPSGRIVEATDGLRLPLGARHFVVFDTPGHARHHVCYFDEQAKAFFTGDTFGLSYRELDVAGRPSIWPTTTPVQFDPEALRASVERLLARRPQAMYLTHFARIEEPARLGADLLRLVDEHLRIARGAAGEGQQRTRGIEAGLRELLLQEGERQGWTLTREALFELMAMDLELNAQGLAIWLDGSSAR